MKPINIYTLTRISDAKSLERLERQMSFRSRTMKIKEWETEGLKAFCNRLMDVLESAYCLDFYYSFTMPKLGKEFDLLRVNDSTVVNVELKSGNVTDEAIKKQLIQNRYYLATLKKNAYFYTYISGDDRLIRLSNSGNLVEADWRELAELLVNQTDCYTDDIEDLFKEDTYLISPLSDPARFLRGEYFLTFQQRDIKKAILKNLDKEGMLVQGFTGLPGTGKTLLLYDIALEMSKYDKVCVLHFGSHAAELEELNERLKRVDFYYCEAGRSIAVVGDYVAIFVDEGHRIDKTALEEIRKMSIRMKAPIIFSYDCEDALEPYERSGYGAWLREAVPGFVWFTLTNKIRLNSELSTFIHCVMRASGNHRRDYPSVYVGYASDEEEAGNLIRALNREGYVYIYDETVNPLNAEQAAFDAIEAGESTCKEFERVVMLMDDSFIYGDDGYLRSKVSKGADDFRVKNIFHGLSRAKERVALVVLGNKQVFDALLWILQK